MAEIMSLQAEMEDEFKEMQNLQKLMKKLVEGRQQLIEQLSECEIVKKVSYPPFIIYYYYNNIFIFFPLFFYPVKKRFEKETDILEADAKIYKLIGPLLVKQDFKECKSNVEKRIEFISKEL